VWDGDLCEKENGAKFTVENAAIEQPRADALEISPTGPIFGTKMMEPKGRELELEQEVLTEAELTLESFDIGKGLSQKGDRRPYRFIARELTSSYADGALTLGFTLPKGCYATVLLKEITKGEDVDLTFGNDD
ncbi:MAG: tRNA pseudouridine(13) synthase TruD, partial [Planctomycetes bacterium]|nr:tRNA pseudouridine(13) synthase TruD [Planctomycetota bacterium]